MNQLFTPKQVAQALGVSESSLKRWCDRGVLQTTRTGGGHRRLPADQVVDFLRRSGRRLVRPELLGLPSNTGARPAVVARARAQMGEALVEGDEEQCRRIVADLYLGGQSVAVICDEVLAEALHAIGDRWSCGELEVYRERRAGEICHRTLADLRSMLPPPPDAAPLAIGAAPAADHYALPSAMIEAVLRQNGWRAQSLGAALPLASLQAAVRDARPDIFWLSVSHIEDEQTFLNEYLNFYEQVRSETAVVVGGRALTESLRRRMSFASYGDNLQHLEAFAKTLMRSIAPAAVPPSSD